MPTSPRALDLHTTSQLNEFIYIKKLLNKFSSSQWYLPKKSLLSLFKLEKTKTGNLTFYREFSTHLVDFNPNDSTTGI